MPETQGADPDRLPVYNDRDAQQRFLTFLRQSLRAITDKAAWLVLSDQPREGLHSAVTRPEVLRLKTVDPERSLYLRSTIQFTFGDHPSFPGERKVFTEFYAHTLSWEPSLHEEIASWQWDPTGYDDPHVHVGRRNPAYGSLGRFHIPTARVTFEQVVRFAFHDFDALPNRSLADTDDERMAVALGLLGESDRRVRKYGSVRR